MKKLTTYIILTVLGFITFAHPAFSQTYPMSRTYVNSVDLREQNGTLYLDMNLNVNQMNIDTDQSLILIPIVTGEQTRDFPGIMINGKNRHKAYLRALNNSREKTMRDYPYVVISAKDMLGNGIGYTHSIPFESWMSTAHLNILEDWCGCGKENALLVSNVANVRVSEIPEPIIAYVQPAGEPIKTRNKEIEVFLDFPVNQTVIKPEYMNNPQELARINSMLQELRNDPDLQVNHLSITGYASPEGSIQGNQRLSEGRANALREYLVSQNYFPANIFSMNYGGENWQGLREMVENSHLSSRSEILSILDNTFDANTRKNQLKSLHGGTVYRQLLNEYYPKLRKAICDVTFQVRAFNVDEAKNIIRTNPEYLSLNEMYYVANSYSKGSDNFTNVFETAVKLYPDDPVANLNNAAAALDSNNTSKAESYLRKADNNSAEYHNNMGIYYMYTGDTNRARTEFQRALSGGFSGAQQNLDILDRYIQTGKLRN